jgi:hypothetical protein
MTLALDSWQNLFAHLAHIPGVDETNELQHSFLAFEHTVQLASAHDKAGDVGGDVVAMVGAALGSRVASICCCM